MSNAERGVAFSAEGFLYVCIYLATLHDVTTMTSEQLELLNCKPEIFRRTSRYQNVRIILKYSGSNADNKSIIIDNYFLKCYEGKLLFFQIIILYNKCQFTRIAVIISN